MRSGEEKAAIWETRLRMGEAPQVRATSSEPRRPWGKADYALEEYSLDGEVLLTLRWPRGGAAPDLIFPAAVAPILDLLLEQGGRLSSIGVVFDWMMPLRASPTRDFYRARASRWHPYGPSRAPQSWRGR